jgi:hypothetical protein
MHKYLLFSKRELLGLKEKFITKSVKDTDIASINFSTHANGCFIRITIRNWLSDYYLIRSRLHAITHFLAFY